MYRIAAHLLIFFVLFTHSAIAMDVHISNASEQASVSYADTQSTSLDLQDCGDLGGHCSHSSTHTSGLASNFTLPSFEKLSVVKSCIQLAPHTYTQSPPRRPPKA